MPTKICAYGMYGLITPMVKIFAAEGPVAAAVRVRRLISSAIRSLRREP